MPSPKFGMFIFVSQFNVTKHNSWGDAWRVTFFLNLKNSSHNSASRNLFLDFLHASAIILQHTNKLTQQQYHLGLSFKLLIWVFSLSFSISPSPQLCTTTMPFAPPPPYLQFPSILSTRPRLCRSPEPLLFVFKPPFPTVRCDCQVW